MGNVNKKVTASAYHARIVRGWSEAQAQGLECPPTKKEWLGNFYSLAELSRIHQYGVSSSTIRRRFELDWSIEKVMITPAASIVKPILGYESRTAAAEANGIKLNTVSNRIMRGMEEAAAVLVPINSDGFETCKNDVYGFIYEIMVSATGLKYVGLTVDLANRRKIHLKHLSHAKPISGELYGDMIIHGQSDITLTLIEPVKTKAELAEREKYWIKKLNTYRNGYNKSTGGELGCSTRNPVAYSGRLYPNIKFACRELELPYAAVYSRMNKNKIDFSDAAKSVFDDGYLYKDHFYSDSAKLARATKTKPTTLYKFLVSEETVEKAVERAKSNMLKNSGERRAETHGTRILWEGKQYLSIPRFCKAINESRKLPKDITPSSISHFMESKNISTQQAIDMIISGEVKRVLPITIANVQYRSLHKACKELGVSYDLVRNRVKPGGPPADVIVLAILKNKQ